MTHVHDQHFNSYFSTSHINTVPLKKIRVIHHCMVACIDMRFKLLNIDPASVAPSRSLSSSIQSNTNNGKFEWNVEGPTTYQISFDRVDFFCRQIHGILARTHCKTARYSYTRNTCKRNDPYLYKNHASSALWAMYV